METNETLDPEYLRARIDDALAEDGAANDSTVGLLELGDVAVRAEITVKSDGVVAGLDVARAVFLRVDDDIEFQSIATDGDGVGRDDLLAGLGGRAGSILAAERVALNFLQSLSGVATMTARFVEAVAGTGVRILDTRKTTPGLRRLQRYAVRVGGGYNHRFNLSDMVLIKENHIRAAGGAKFVTEMLARSAPDTTIEIEVDTLDLLQTILGSPVDRIMLDNLTPDEVRGAVDMIGKFRSQSPDFNPTIEVSGGVNLENIAGYAVEGVSEISIGQLTHSVRALDISLEVMGGR